jgi:hypothetical protein
VSTGEILLCLFSGGRAENKEQAFGRDVLLYGMSGSHGGSGAFCHGIANMKKSVTSGVSGFLRDL